MKDEDKLSRGDMRLFEQASRNRWPISNEYRRAMIARLMQIIADPNSSKREVTSASRALIAAESQNQADQCYERESDADRNRFLAIAVNLGLVEGAGGVAEGGSQGNIATVDGSVRR